MSTATGGSGRRVALVAGLRTPFVKSGTGFAETSAVELGAAVVGELVERAALDPAQIDLLVFGQVVPTPLSTLIAREVVLRAGLPRRIEAHTVSRACATSIQALTSAIDALAAGRGEVAIAGGAESLSDVPLFCSKGLARALVQLSKARTMKERLAALKGLKVKDLAPEPPSIKEPTTGLTMGESAEKMARDWSITREAQDRLALESHRRAAAAREAGRFEGEVMQTYVPPRYERPVVEDNLVRADTTLEALGRLRPVFDKRYGTITAGNSSPLTDGAAAILLMSDERARALGYAPMGYVRSWAYAALDPNEHLLMGPSYATPLALERAGLRLSDMGVIDLHEAFAAQVLCNVAAFASRDFARDKLGREKPIGEIDPARLNVNGGAIALGHPFGATGARMVTSTLREMARRDVEFGLVTLCTAGGMGAAVVLERA